MRFCLRCRNFSGGGPICTHCGRSFGGRLCRGRTRHLNPFDALFCNFCGTADLDEGARSIPLGWVSRLLIVGGFFFVGRWLIATLVGTPNLVMQSLTHYRNLGMCIIQYLGHILVFLFLFYFLSSLIPGEAGKQFRAISLSFTMQIVKLFFKVLERGFYYLGCLLLKIAGIERESKKKKKNR